MRLCSLTPLWSLTRDKDMVEWALSLKRKRNVPVGRPWSQVSDSVAVAKPIKAGILAPCAVVTDLVHVLGILTHNWAHEIIQSKNLEKPAGASTKFPNWSRVHKGSFAHVI